MMLAEKVIAIGSPFGYEGTVSVGIISALNREVTMPNDLLFKGLIQTTAPINPGNWVDLLININGEVIGINVAIHDEAQNIAFAINAGTVENFLNSYSKQQVAAGQCGEGAGQVARCSRGSPRAWNPVGFFRRAQRNRCRLGRPRFGVRRLDAAFFLFFGWALGRKKKERKRRRAAALKRCQPT